jgi:hypothetical protein
MGVLLGPYDADFAGRQMAISRTDLAHSRRIDLQEWRGSARRALSGHGSSGAGSAVALLSLGRAGRVSQPRFTVHDIAFRARLFPEQYPTTQSRGEMPKPAGSPFWKSRMPA